VNPVNEFNELMNRTNKRVRTVLMGLTPMAGPRNGKTDLRSEWTGCEETLAKVRAGR
jgi:hypothetical protein